MLGPCFRVFSFVSTFLTLSFFSIPTLANEDADEDELPPRLSLPIISAEPSEYDAPVAVSVGDGDTFEGQSRAWLDETRATDFSDFRGDRSPAVLQPSEVPPPENTEVLVQALSELQTEYVGH